MHGGLGLDHSYLRPWLDPLGADLRLVYYDHRGNGRSGRPPLDTLTLAQLCADADALREHLGFSKVAVLGHSIGGLIALEYALRYPQHLSHLVLVGTGARCDFGSLPARLERMDVAPEIRAAFGAGLDSDAALERFFEIAAPICYHAFDAEVAARHRRHVIYDVAACKRGMALVEDLDLGPRLGEIAAATLIVAGRNDVFYPLAEVDRLAGGIAGAELVVFEDSGHHPYLEESERFVEVIHAWLGRTGSANAQSSR